MDDPIKDAREAIVVLLLMTPLFGQRPLVLTAARSSSRRSVDCASRRTSRCIAPVR
jgi:hypothetical protein